MEGVELSDPELLSSFTLVDLKVLQYMSNVSPYHGNVCRVQDGPHAFTVCLPLDLRLRFQLLPKAQQEFLLQMLMERSHSIAPPETDKDDDEGEEEEEEEKGTLLLMIEEYENWRQNGKIKELFERLKTLFEKLFDPSGTPCTPDGWQYEISCDITSMAFLCFINRLPKNNSKTSPKRKAKQKDILEKYVVKKCFTYVQLVQQYGRELSKKYEFVLAKKRAKNDTSDTKLTLFNKFTHTHSNWYKKNLPAHIRKTVFDRLCFFNMPDERFVLKQKEQ